MAVVEPPPDSSNQNTKIANVVALPFQKRSPQSSETDDNNEKRPVVYNTIRVTVRRIPRKTEIDIAFDVNSYIFLEQDDLKTGIKSISFLKNHETEWQKSFPQYTQSTVLMDFARMFTDQNINRPGTVVKELRIFYTRYSGSSFCSNLFSLVNPELVTVESLQLETAEAVIDQNFVNVINNIRATNIELLFTFALGNREFLLDIQSKKKQIYEGVRITMADAELVAEQIKKLILIDYVIGSYYQVEQLRDSLPKDFLQTVVAELQSAEPARQSKSFETPKKKTVPLTFIVSVTPTTDLEIYNDNFNIIAVLTESETFPPVNMKNLPPLVLEKKSITFSDTVRSSCCLFAPCRR